MEESHAKLRDRPCLEDRLSATRGLYLQGSACCSEARVLFKCFPFGECGNPATLVVWRFQWIDETKYGALVGDEDINLYYIVEAAVSKVSELMRYLRRNVRKADLLDMDSSEEWLKQMYDEWPISGRTLSTGRVLKKNAGEISLTILAEVFAWYHDDVDTLTIYKQDTDAHEFQTSAEQKLKGNREFSPALESPISVAFKSNDFILCQMYREGILTMDDIRQLRRDDRKLTYTKQRADKSVVCRKEVVTKEQFVELIQDATVQILF